MKTKMLAFVAFPPHSLAYPQRTIPDAQNTEISLYSLWFTHPFPHLHKQNIPALHKRKIFSFST